MKLVIQRVNKGQVKIENKIVGDINKGYVVLVAFKKGDDKSSFPFMIRKLLNLKLFNDENNRLNKSLLDVAGELLLVSQFTLYARIANGNSPGWDDAMPYEKAEKLYNEFIIELEKVYNKKKIQSGQFGAEMKVILENDGPVTIILEK